MTGTSQNRFRFDFSDDCVLKLALQIADDAARSDIECYCALRMDSGGEPQNTEDHSVCWYDSLAIPDPEMEGTVQIALIYLCARGMVRWHKTNRGWIRPVDAGQEVFLSLL